MADKLKLLKEVDFFSSMNEEHLMLFAEMADYKCYAKDEIILRENDKEFRSFFLIVKGQVKVSMLGIDGTEAILAILNKGEFFGEMSLIDGEPRSASVKAVEKSELVVICRNDFLKELQDNFKLCMSVMVEMSRRIRKVDKKISNLALMSVYGRIATTIMDIIKKKGTQSILTDGTDVNITYNFPSQQQIADMSGTTREAVSEAISYLQGNGVVTLSDNVLYVFQKPLLKI